MPACCWAAHHGIERAAAIRIAKGIPVAGGLAGGSADAAASLVALDRLWDLDTSDEDLLRLAAQLGSDVPFALLGGTALGTGRGEVVEPIEDPGTWWWVVVPNATGMSTPEVYREFDRLNPDLRSHVHLRVHDMTGILRARDFRLLGRNLDERPAGGGAEPATGAGQDRHRPVRAGRVPAAVRLRADLPRPRRDPGARARGAPALMDRGYRGLQVATGPVAGAHLVEYI